MGSSRMPGKTMAELAGRSSLHHIIERLRRVPNLDGIVVATTTGIADDVIADCARAAGVSLYRGSADDVLARTLKAARSVGAATIVTVTADCPLTDPLIVEQVIGEYRRHRPDYASNRLDGYKYPKGMDVEVFLTVLLEEIEKEAREPRDREHVTLFFYEHPERFRLLGIEPSERHRRPELRLTLDTPDDYKLISALYDALYDDDPCFGLDAVLDCLERHPEFAALNNHVPQVIP
jgi:spore coat polysaccharide biosynthesis protein SpsF